MNSQRRWSVAGCIVALLALTCGASAHARSPAKPPKPPKAAQPDRRFTVNGQSVAFPASWLACEKAADCVWVIAGCDEAETGVNARYKALAERRFAKACATSNHGMLRALHTDPPACEHHACAAHIGGTLDLDALMPGDGATSR